jgi:hypothetical protein
LFGSRRKKSTSARTDYFNGNFGPERKGSEEKGGKSPSK